MSEKDDKHANNYHELHGPEGIAKIAEMVEGIRICMLSTVVGEGYAVSRPMATQDVAFEGMVYFLTRSTSGKVENIAGNQRVTLDYADPGDSKYVTLRGVASVYRDQKKIDEMWNPMYKAWFPEGKEDPEIAILKVEIREGEYWEANSSKIIMGIKYVAAAVTGGKVPVGEAGHLDVA